MKNERGLEDQSRYVAVNIPVPLMRQLQKIVNEQGSFMSPTDYVTYILRVLVSLHAEDSENELLTREDLMQIKTRFEALGRLPSKVRTKRASSTEDPRRGREIIA